MQCTAGTRLTTRKGVSCIVHKFKAIGRTIPTQPESPSSRNIMSIEIRPTGRDLGAEILKVCIDVGGSITGEHGVGADKRCYLDWMFSSNDLETMRLLRNAFDPDRLANPGKIFPTPQYGTKMNLSIQMAHTRIEWHGKFIFGMTMK